MNKHFKIPLIHLVLAPLIFLISVCSSIAGSACTDNTVTSMAVAFDRYLKNSGQDYVAAEFSSDEKNDPLRRGEFNQASMYQNLWQLSKGPDNSLIRVNRPIFFEPTQSVVAPLTLYPKESIDDDSNALEPVIYSGFDQDFKGDYLDIKIMALKNSDKQISWSDFYRGGKFENYRTDTHSIMVSESLARRIYSTRHGVDVQSVTSDNIESLVGTHIRSKVISETGVAEAVEREASKESSIQDTEIVNSVYYSSKSCKVKRIIGILSDKSAEKYFPIFGTYEFVFVIPTPYVSYDYFHPTIYGMFKTNLVGNRTSLRYFMSFGEAARSIDKYHLYFCDVINGELSRDGFLQKNYESLLDFYLTNKYITVSSIFWCITILILSILVSIIFYLHSRKKDLLVKYGTSLLIETGSSFVFAILLLYLLKSFSFFNYAMPTLTIIGFVSFSFTSLLLLFMILLLSRKNEENAVAHNLAPEVTPVASKKEHLFSKISSHVLVIGIAFVVCILVSVLRAKSSVTSIGFPCAIILFGFSLGYYAALRSSLLFVRGERKIIFKKRLLLVLLLVSDIIAGSLLSSLFAKIGLVWIQGISISISGILISVLCSSLLVSLIYISGLFSNNFRNKRFSSCGSRLECYIEIQI